MTSSSTANSSAASAAASTATAIAGAVALLGSVAYYAFSARKKRNAFSTAYTNTTTMSKDEVRALRQRHFSSSLSVSYANTGPLLLVEGRGVHLRDERGAAYLDARNNVAHCGHCHPAVVRAVQDQVARLNTHTRYLHPHAGLLAERLCATLPAELDTVFFVNSGSEANDLALRLARAWSGGSRHTVTVDAAYHGHTLAVLEVSPYKYETSREYCAPGGNREKRQPPPPHNKGDDERPSPGPHIQKVPCPDTFRGEHRDLATAGPLYARYVEQACRTVTDRGETVRAFIVEGGMSVAGVILPPPGYLPACANAVHRAGGLWIADEVQTGFGRLGTCYWAHQYRHPGFEEEDDIVTPDIVTVGKPFGNGMPLAAVVTSRRVARVFEECGVEYFNTFGGNPVCAAAGLAVLDVIEKEGLQQNALEVGNYLKKKLLELQRKVDLIGDVRGSGLFVGIEFVESCSSLEPATAITSWLCSILKTKYRVLSSIDGPGNNVLVVKPPMVFSRADVDYFVGSIEGALTEDLPLAGEIEEVKTPT